MRVASIIFLVLVFLSSFAQPSQAPLQSFVNAGGATGTITSGIPTHFSSIGQPMVLPRLVPADNAGGVMAAHQLMFTTVGGDTTPPEVVTNNTALTIEKGVALPITANFRDLESSVTGALVQYRSTASSGNQYKDGTLTKGTGETWTGSIPADSIGDLGVEYKFKVTNGASLQATSELYKASVNFPSGVPITINTTYAKDQKNYRIIAIPIEPAASVNTTFSAEFGNYDPNVWRMYHYHTARMNHLSGDSLLKPGFGYWFISTKTPLGTLTSGAGKTVEASSQQPFVVTLNPGWNQIGNPYQFDISWQDVKSANPSIQANLPIMARSYNGSQIEIDRIKKFEGAFISFSGTSRTSLVFPVVKKKSINGRIGSNKIHNPLSNEHWEVQIQLSNGIQQYDLGGLGMHPEAKDAVDEFDDFNLPRFFEYLELKHPKQFYDMTFTKDMVKTEINHTWEFTTETNQPAESITVEWDNSYFGNGAQEIWLMDVETSEVWDMRAKNRVQVNYASIRRWKVAFGNKDYVEEATLPDYNLLVNVFPNPFSNEVSMELAISKPGPVRLEILDINGHGVWTLNLELERGRHRFNWEGRDVSTGLYLVRFQSGAVTMSKRLLKR